MLYVGILNILLSFIYRIVSFYIQIHGMMRYDKLKYGILLLIKYIQNFDVVFAGLIVKHVMHLQDNQQNQQHQLSQYQHQQYHQH